MIDTFGGVRQSSEPANAVGRILYRFRGLKHLSKREAAKVLGVSYTHLRSFEAGIDVTTGLPFRPRDATLRHLAARMTEEGFSISFEELKSAAEQGEAPAGKELPPAPKSGRVQRMLEEVGQLPEDQQERFFQAAEALLAAMRPGPGAPHGRASRAPR